MLCLLTYFFDQNEILAWLAFGGKLCLNKAAVDISYRCAPCTGSNCPALLDLEVIRLSLGLSEHHAKRCTAACNKGGVTAFSGRHKRT